MSVELTCEHIRNVISPFYAVLLELMCMFLNNFQNRCYLILRIFEETEQQLKCAVACTSAHSVNGSVKVAYALSHSLDCVCKCKLLIVVCVDTYSLVVFVSN